MFQKRNLEYNDNLELIRIPWDFQDTINRNYYYAFIQSHPLAMIGHITYVYNINYIFIFIFVIEAIILMVMVAFYPQINSKIELVYWIFPCIWIFLVLSQATLKTTLMSLAYYPKKKWWNEIFSFFQKESFSLKDILERPTAPNNPLESTQWEVDMILQVYICMKIDWKHPITNMEPIDIVRSKTLFQNMDKMMDIKFYPSDFMKDNAKCIEKLENIWVYYWINLCIRYKEYPDKTITYNIDRYLWG